MDFIFSKRGKTVAFILMVIGVVSLIAGYVIDGHDLFWSNLYVNGLFFTFVSLGALFFLALQYATEAAWSQMVRRLYEATMSYLPIGLGVIVLVLLMGSLHQHHIFHWMAEGVYAEYIVENTIGTDHPEYAAEAGAGVIANSYENNPKGSFYDKIIAGKKAYLNQPFFWIRTISYVAVFIFFGRFFRRKSLEEDRVGGTEINYINYRRGALFLVFFAVFSSMLSWDWIMSIDTHWFSTMFGWYTFSGMWVSAMIVAVILVLYLKSKGLMPQVNNSHIHDMGKWMFAISFLWTYLWFSQFMLIWYSNIPEEVTYFVTRFENYGFPMFAMVGINFILPMVILMSRDAKRNMKFLVTIGTIIFFGHWFDNYLMVIPGVQFDHWHGLQWWEIGMMLGFLGLFMFTVLNALSKAKLVPQNSPYMSESLQHHI